MDTIAFVIAEEELGMGMLERAQPHINGIRLVELLTPRGQHPRYGGLTAQTLKPSLHRSYAAEDRMGRRCQVLGCVCGDAGCSWVMVHMTITDDEVAWHDFVASGEDATVRDLGPFRFARAQYEAALI